MTDDITTKSYVFNWKITVIGVNKLPMIMSHIMGIANKTNEVVKTDNNKKEWLLCNLCSAGQRRNYRYDGIVGYARGGRKTKFNLSECQIRIKTDVHGRSFIFTESDADIVALAMMTDEQRLTRNNDHTETRYSL